MKAALLVIDLQKGFIKDYPCYPNIGLTLEYVNAAIELFAARNLPVVVVKDRDALEEDYPDPYDLLDGLNLSDVAHQTVEKSYPNAFWETDLLEVLEPFGVEYLVLTGYAAEFCVYGTYNGAVERGFHPLVMKNGITSQGEGSARMIQDITNGISYFTLNKMLNEE